MAQANTREIGERLRRARQKAGLTQAALAEAAGVTDETISRVERGAYEPALSTLMAIVTALDVDLSAVAEPEVRGRSSPNRSSPLTRRLLEQFERLDAPAQRTLVKLAELLAQPAPFPRSGLQAGEPRAPFGPRRRRKRSSTQAPKRSWRPV